MFMGNDEIKNTYALTVIKFRSTRTYMLKSLLLIGLAFVAILIPSIVNVLKYEAPVTDIRIYDYSAFLLLGLLGGALISCIRYKHMSDYYSVFPQTGTSRFLSTQFILYLWLAFVSLLSLVVYMIQFVIFKLLSMLNSNIILAFRADLGLVLTGVFIFFLYGMIMISFFSLMATLIRKFNEIAIAILMIIAAILITSEEGLFKTIANISSFLTKEPKISIFLMKGLLVWLILFVTAFLVNRSTVYYKTQRKYKNSIVTAVGVASLILISIVRAGISVDGRNIVITNSFKNFSFHDDEYDIWQDKTILLDASDYKDLSPITVTTNFDLSDNMMTPANEHIIPFGDTIEIRYRLPVHIMNYYNLTELTNPTFTAKLEDHKLILDYSYHKNTKVIFLSPWFVMKQFEKYQDKNLFFRVSDFYTTNSKGTGHVDISPR